MEATIIRYFQQKDARTDWDDRYYYKEALRQFRPLLTKLVYRYVAKNRRDEFMLYAELAVFRALEAYDASKGTLVTCIYTYVKRALLNEMNADNRFSKHHIAVDDVSLHVLYEKKGAEFVDVSDYFEEYIVQKVSEEELAFLVALYVEGYSYEDISAQTGVAVETLKKRRQRLVARLKAARRV
ncbi:MAG: sigma-70 family RNA polymerase sigma factor [Caryophanon sp.]|nr:sigma-70 family RNA polymerase sigma factor [Caryophanon sp.]